MAPSTPFQARMYSSTRGGVNDGVDRYLEATPNRETLVSQGLPAYTEMTRQGNGWQVMDTSAAAALVIRPTTTAGLTLYNGNAAGGASYIIDRACIHQLVSTDAIEAYSLWACVHSAGHTAAAADITAIKGMSGNTYAGNATVEVDMTVTDSGWFPIADGEVGNPGTTTPGGVAVAVIAGRFLIPPTGAFSLQVVGSLTSATFTHGISWYEQALDLE